MTVGSVSKPPIESDWEEWESVLRGFLDSCGLDALSEMLPDTAPDFRDNEDSAARLGPLDLEVLSEAMGWLRSYIVCSAGFPGHAASLVGDGGWRHVH